MSDQARHDAIYEGFLDVIRLHAPDASADAELVARTLCATATFVLMADADEPGKLDALRAVHTTVDG